MASKYDFYIPSVKWLHEQQKTDSEIARHIGIDSRRVGDIRNRIGLKRNDPSERPIILTEEQKQVLIGGIVGDMCIFKDEKSTYHRMNLAHSSKQEEYLLLKKSLLGDLFGEPTKRSWIDKRTKNEYHEIRIQSKTHKLFTSLYNKWYKNGRKVMHDDIWKIDSLGLAIIYFDDGCKTDYGYEIYLNDYSKKDIKKLADVIMRKFDLKCTIPKRGDTIYIQAECRDQFKQLLRPYITRDTEYKL